MLFYDILNSSYTHEYVCKKWKPGHEPTSAPPTPIPFGHCGDDHTHHLTEFNGYCYKFAGMNKDEAFPWTEANLKCDELGNGYKLASIHNEREYAFIYTMLAELDEIEYESKMLYQKFGIPIRPSFSSGIRRT